MQRQRVSGVEIAAALSGSPVPETTRARSFARLQYPYQFEEFNVLLVPAWAFFILIVTGATIGWPAFSGFLLPAGQLAAGAAYWRIKLGQLQRDELADQLPKVRVFRALRRGGPLALLLGALAWAQPSFTGQASTLEATVGISLWILAALKHVNCCHWRPAHDTSSDLSGLRTTRRSRRSFPANDIDRSARRARGG